MERLLILVGGAVQALTASYLFIYYYLHSQKVIKGKGSKFFRDLAYTFIPPAIMGFIWLASSILFFLGQGILVLDVVLLITAFAVTIYSFVLIKFVMATNQE